MTNKFYPISVKEITKETEDTVTLSFDIPEHLHSLFEYRSGQYLTIKTSINGEELRRSYSLCTAPHEGKWVVAVKKINNGIFSSYANERLKSGDVLDVMPPQGSFLLPEKSDREQTIVFFASGSGITPIMAQIRTILDLRIEKVILFYGNKNTESIVFREELEALKNQYLERFSLHYILSKEHLGSELFYGRIDKNKCSLFCKYFIEIGDIKGVYLCGPSEMIFNIKEALIEEGVMDSKIHYELFHAPTQHKQESIQETTEDSSKMSKVKVRLDGLTFEYALLYNGKSILDSALENGADLPFACKGGVCSTCKAKVTQGKVQMDVNYALEEDEVEAGYVLTCQSHPRSSEIMVDFDA